MKELILNHCAFNELKLMIKFGKLDIKYELLKKIIL